MSCQEKFDIFQGQVDQEPIWIEVVAGLGCALERMKELAAEKPAHYFIMSLNTREVLGYVATITDAVGDARRIVERIETHNGRGR